MSILNIRIDERLIHGQVATVWTNQLNITRILVIDDLAAVDDIQKIALKMACPSSSRLSILNAERAVQRLNENAYDKDRLMIIMRGRLPPERFWIWVISCQPSMSATFRIKSDPRASSILSALRRRKRKISVTSNPKASK